MALDLAPERTLDLASGTDIRGLSRCVRLNNYWCIKRAGWSGEIASDGEGHVAFASAREGAAVAALLLRRYYVDFGLKTARAIVSRWAPAAQCGTSIARIRTPPRAVGVGASDGLARRGLGNTLRARWLASHTLGGFSRGGMGRRAPLRSVIARGPAPSRVDPTGGTPVIMAGLGAPVGAPVRLAMLPYPGLAMGAAPGARASILPVLPLLPPVLACTTDGARVASYAARAADGVVAGPDKDLALFDAAGQPTDNLAKVMANMAAVEIGPLRASDPLVKSGISSISARKR